MRKPAILATVLAALLASGAAFADVTTGPAVAPHGPGHVSIVWESTGGEPQTVTLGSAGRGNRTVVSQAAAGGVHRVELQGLEPGVEYQYRIGDRRGRFMSPPDATQDVRFAVLGDSQRGDSVHRQVVERVVALRPDFYLNTGDVVPTGESMEEWRNFFDIERPLLEIAPFSGVRGNHDAGRPFFEQLFTMRSDTPGAGATWGSMDLGPAHFLLVDTEAPVGRGSPQYEFIARDLAANEARPLFVFMHKPLFSSGWHGGDEGIQQALGPLFQRHGVDVVFQGHDHHYERTTPINGVTYVVTGGAGAPLRGARASAWTRVAESSHHFMMVEASATRVRVLAKRLDGTQLDAFELDPRANNGRFSATQRMPSPGGAGCAALFFGRGRSERHAALGAFGPTLGFVLVRGVRRRKARAARAGRA